MSIALDPNAISQSTAKIRAHLEQYIVGQQHAIDKILNLYVAGRSGLRTGTTRGNVALLGPTGVGKTAIVERLAEATLGSQTALTKIDCGEFQHSHEIAKLLGSPPGYLGHRETHARLSPEQVYRDCRNDDDTAIVLFDEIEKASDAVWNLMLNMLDKAEVVTGTNQATSFDRAMIFMTSNVGAEEAMGTHPGFKHDKHDSAVAAEADIRKAFQRKFTPEFINRIDESIVFHTLTKVDCEKIIDIQLLELQRLLNSRLYDIEFDASVRSYLLANGYSDKYGARNIKRLIVRDLMTPISNIIDSKQITVGQKLTVKRLADSLIWQTEELEEATNAE